MLQAMLLLVNVSETRDKLFSVRVSLINKSLDFLHRGRFEYCFVDNL